MSRSPVFDQKLSGAYFTPTDVARALVAWTVRQPSDRLIDPSCGDGQFVSAHTNSVGIEQNPLSAEAAMAAAPGALIHQGDFFSWAFETQERFDCAVGNPPFIRYQAFKGETRRSALEICARLGVKFSGLTSSWAPFLAAAAGLLRAGGRLAFVVPAEIGHAPYAAPLLEYLVSSFATVHVIAIRQKLFPALSEDCWLLYADGYGSSTKHIGLTVCEAFKPTRHRPKPEIMVDVDEWRNVWCRRLRPFLLPKAIRDLYADVADDTRSSRFGDFARIGIGYVSGDNNFFHLRASEARKLKIPSEFLIPALRNGRAMPAAEITDATVGGWIQKDDKFLLLRLTRDHDLPSSILGYLDSEAGREARLTYKCRNRTPWYAIPDVQVPDYVLSYMSGRAANLVLNTARVTCTNSVHSVRIQDKSRAMKKLPLWNSSFVRLSCELEGHALGGGMLKLEPREATRILFPSETFAFLANREALEDAIGTLQSWRHYVN